MKMKTVLGTRLATPDVGGFPDKVQIFNGDTGGMLIYECYKYGTNPNPVNPHTGQPWYECEGQLATGTYSFTCIQSEKHGKCLALNGLATVPTTRPNLNPDTANPGTETAQDVEIHCGYRSDAPGRPGWRGSLCCQTVSPDAWPVFISHFELGEKGTYQLVDTTDTETA
jgi:hypothetical protein